MAGTVVNWLLGAALATVAAIAGRRLLRWLQWLRPGCAVDDRAVHGRAVHSGVVHDSFVHLVTALGMVAMLVLADWGAALRWGFGGLALVLLLTSRGGHRLHHVAMAGIMALMAGAPHRVAATMMPTMSMQSGVSDVHGYGLSPLLLAAFGYACVSALVIAWRLPAAANAHAHGIDAVGRACEIAMFLSTAVMLLPML